MKLAVMNLNSTNCPMLVTLCYRSHDCVNIDNRVEQQLNINSAPTSFVFVSPLHSDVCATHRKEVILNDRLLTTKVVATVICFNY